MMMESRQVLEKKAPAVLGKFALAPIFVHPSWSNLSSFLLSFFVLSDPSVKLHLCISVALLIVRKVVDSTHDVCF